MKVNGDQCCFDFHYMDQNNSKTFFKISSFVFHGCKKDCTILWVCLCGFLLNKSKAHAHSLAHLMRHYCVLWREKIIISPPQPSFTTHITRYLWQPFSFSTGFSGSDHIQHTDREETKLRSYWCSSGLINLTGQGLSQGSSKTTSFLHT